MKIDIYKSKDTANRYFVVLSGSDVSHLPERVIRTPEKTIDINPGEEKIGLSADNVISDINSVGYHASDVVIRVGEYT